MNKNTLRDLKDYSTYLDLFSDLSSLNNDKETETRKEIRNEKYQVKNLANFLDVLKNHKIEIEHDVSEFENTRFSVIRDEKGKRIELWELVETAPF